MKDKCTICQSVNRKKLFLARDPKSKRNYTFYKCLDCQTVRIHPQIKSKEIKEIYCHKNIHGDFEKNNLQFKFLGFIPFLHVLFRLYLKRILINRKNIILSRRKRGVILDIGFGDSNFLKSFNNNNWHLWGIEINKDLTEIARKRLPKAKLKNADIKTANLPKDFFDVITLWHVFEHIKTPHTAMEKISFWLKKGGFLFIEVPSSNSLYLNIYGQNWQQLIAPEHQFFYSKNSLPLLLQKHGLRVINVRNLGLTPFSPSASFSNLLISKGINANLASSLAILTYPMFLMINLFLFSKRENLQIIAKK